MSGSEADWFAAAYTALRARERWAERDRMRRGAAVADAVATIREELGAAAVIVDVGAGARRMEGVTAIDLLPGACVRADMRALPLADGSVDGLTYAASLHYAPLDTAVGEAARVLRTGGLLIALDSPVYSGAAAASAARARSAAYYTSAGHPVLAEHYHPIEVGALRDALARTGLGLVRLSLGSRWRRALRRGPGSLIVARKLR